MTPSRMEPGQRLVIEVPADGIDYTFSHEDGKIWFGACVRVDVRPEEPGEEPHLQVKLKPKQADKLFAKLQAAVS